MEDDILQLEKIAWEKMEQLKIYLLQWKRENFWRKAFSKCNNISGIINSPYQRKSKNHVFVQETIKSILCAAIYVLMSVFWTRIQNPQLFHDNPIYKNLYSSLSQTQPNHQI